MICEHFNKIEIEANFLALGPTQQLKQADIHIFNHVLGAGDLKLDILICILYTYIQ